MADVVAADKIEDIERLLPCMVKSWRVFRVLMLDAGARLWRWKHVLCATSGWTRRVGPYNRYVLL